MVRINTKAVGINRAKFTSKRDGKGLNHRELKGCKAFVSDLSPMTTG